MGPITLSISNTPQVNGWLVLILAGVAWLCPAFAYGHEQPPVGCSPMPARPENPFLQPLNIDLIKRELLYYRCSRYDADIPAVLNDAKDWLERRRAQVSNPAIVLDIDETSISNWTRIHKNDFAYIVNGTCDLAKLGDPCGDIAWQESGQAPAIRPTLDLFDLAKCNSTPPVAGCTKVAVFFVTGRYKIAKERTERNLLNAHYNDWDGLYLRDPATAGQPVSFHKIAARIDIERLGFTIIANIGDQQSDLAGGHAERTFKIPNPFYFID